MKTSGTKRAVVVASLAISCATLSGSRLARAELPVGIQHISVDETRLRTHVMRPTFVQGMHTDRGREEGLVKIPVRVLPKTQVAPHLNVDKFGKALHATLKDSVTGYAMQLRRNGNPAYTLIWNWAQTPANGSEGWTLDRRMHIASVSKLMTGIAMTKLLDEKHISYDTKISGYLPTYWSKGQNVDKITFRHLLTHTSGFNTGGSDSDYMLMKSKVAAGVGSVGQYHYENMNFGLCRILISVINGSVAKNIAFPPQIADQAWDYVTINAYKQYVQDNVFGPAGVSNATLDHPANAALAYNFPAAGGGWDSGDLSTMSGGAGWHMSVNEVLNVMGTLRRKGTIMPKDKAQSLLDNLFGIDVAIDTPAGKVYNKNGLWQDGGGHTEQSLAYFLPEDMEMVLLVNSPIGHPSQFFRDLVTNIYAQNIE